MSVCRCFIIFMAASFAGWIYECIYCTLKTTRWQNRGFLFGPVCPIYGCGVVGALLLFRSCLSDGRGQLSLLQIFLICAAGSAVLEYTTSFLLEKLFGARWWDYSNVPLNLNGRICLPATMGFGAAGVVFVGFVFPAMHRFYALHPMQIPPVPEQVCALALMLVFGADLGLSISSVSSLINTMERIEAQFDDIMETYYAPIGKTQRSVAGKIASAGHSAAGKVENVAGRVEIVAEKVGRVNEYREALMNQAKQFSQRQINTLMNIRVFSSVGRTRMAGRLRDMLPGRKNNTDETT